MVLQNQSKGTSKLEFYNTDQTPIVQIVDGTGCTINGFSPKDGRDMLKKLKLLIPPKQQINNSISCNNTVKELERILSCMEKHLETCS